MTYPHIGLVLGIIGTVLVALAFGTDSQAGQSEDSETGEVIDFVFAKHPNWIYCGLALIIIGTALQW